MSEPIYTMGPEDEVSGQSKALVPEDTVADFVVWCSGKSLAEAKERGQQLGVEVRVERPNEMRTMDFRTDRVNVVIKDGVVDLVSVG